MVFVQFADPIQDREGRRYLLNSGYRPVAFGSQKDGLDVFAVPRDVLDNLDAEGINYLDIPEKDLPKILSINGLRTYQSRRRANPEQVYFDSRPFKKGEVAVELYVSDRRVRDAREIALRYATQVYLLGGLVSLGVDTNGRKPRIMHPRVRVSFSAREEDIHELRELLEAEKIAGHDRTHPIYTVPFSDPGLKLD